MSTPELVPAIQVAIGDALEALFAPLALTSDRLALKTAKLFPLQDDPTLVAPYVIFAEHPQLGETEDAEMGAEVGGGIHIITHWRMIFGTSRATTRQQVYQDIYGLRNRLIRALQSKQDLEGLINPGALHSYDFEEVMEGNNAHDMIDGAAVHIFGGNGQFYGEGKAIWHYRFRRNRNW